MKSKLSLSLFIVCAAPLLMAERCGPATSLEPAYVAGAVLLDDTLAGDYVALSFETDGGGSGKKAKAAVFPPARISREDTVDGPSYVLEVQGEPELKDVRLRMFLFELGGVRFADMVAEDASKSGTFAKSLALPQHLLFRIARPPGGGVSLDYLDAKWLDVEAVRDPKSISLRAPPRRFEKREGSLRADREPVIMSDTAALQKLLQRAASEPQAWSVGLELAKKGSPALRFSVTWQDTEISRDASGSTVTYEVMGSRLEVKRQRSGRANTAPALEPANAHGTIKEPAKLDALLRAFERTGRTRPAVPVPASDTHLERVCVERKGGRPRCVERVLGDNSGADLEAARALLEALRAEAQPQPPP